MRVLTFAIVFLGSTTCAFAQEIDIKAIEEQAALLKPEKTALVACLSDVVDRAKAQGSTDAEFKETLLKSCLNEREALRKALLDRMVPALKVDPSKGEEAATWAVQLLLIPIFNEFSGKAPYRYRLKDAEKAKTPTSEDSASNSATEKYFECLSTFAMNSKANGISSDVFKKSLDSVCLEEAEAVHQAELRVWDTYIRPPMNRDAAGKAAIRLAKAAAVRKYREASK